MSLLIDRVKTEDLLPRPSDCLKRDAILQFYTSYPTAYRPNVTSRELGVSRSGATP